MLNGLKPELVTPLVLRLCAQHNQNSGDICEVGGGWMAKLRWQRNKGLAFDANSILTPEQIDAQWQTLNAFTDVDYPGTYIDAVEAIKPAFDNLGIASPQ